MGVGYQHFVLGDFPGRSRARRMGDLCNHGIMTWHGRIGTASGVFALFFRFPWGLFSGSVIFDVSGVEGTLRTGMVDSEELVCGVLLGSVEQVWRRRYNPYGAVLERLMIPFSSCTDS